MWIDFTLYNNAPNKISIKYSDIISFEEDTYCRVLTVNNIGRHLEHFDPGRIDYKELAANKYEHIQVTDSYTDIAFLMKLGKRADTNGTTTKQRSH